MGDRTAEQWGRVAVALPGWQPARGMTDTWGRTAVEDGIGGLSWESPFNPKDDAEPEYLPDPNDPATAGCLLSLLGAVAEAVWFSGDCSMWVVQHDGERLLYTSLGRACIAAAEALGRWPGGAE